MLASIRHVMGKLKKNEEKKAEEGFIFIFFKF